LAAIKIPAGLLYPAGVLFPDIGLQRRDVFGEGVASRVGDAADGAGHLAPEGLFDFDVIRFRQLVQLYRKVARRGSGLLPDEDESALSTPMRIDITARRSSECSRGLSSLNTVPAFVIAQHDSRSEEEDDGCRKGEYELGDGLSCCCGPENPCGEKCPCNAEGRSPGWPHSISITEVTARSRPTTGH